MTLTPSDILNLIPVLTDAHKKTPIEPRIEAMDSLLNIDNFHSVEPTFVPAVVRVAYCVCEILSWNYVFKS